MPLRRPALSAATVLLLAACASSPPSSPPVAPSSGSGSPVPVSASASPSGPGESAPASPIAGDPPAIALDLVTDGLADPIGITGTPDGWLLVNERSGRVIAVDPDTGEREVALDVTDRVTGGGEQGLLGLVLHPDWPEDPRGFIYYTALNLEGVLSAVTATQEEPGGPPTFDAASESILMRIPDFASNHNGGQLEFGPDGFLYVGLGDGGGGGDPEGNGQNTSTILGSILRLDVSSPEYAIPSDNPFAEDPDAAPEIFLYGLRNPWRFSFDSETGLLWVADVGQNAWEEVDRVDPVTQAGANLGWNIMEASHCFSDAECSTDGLLLPLAEYSSGPDAANCSVTGGYVYRGEAFAELVGWYLFADICSGLVFALAADAEPASTGALAPTVILESGLAISAFGLDSDGELYLADLGGGDLYRVVAAP